VDEPVPHTDHVAPGNSMMGCLKIYGDFAGCFPNDFEGPDNGTLVEAAGQELRPIRLRNPAHLARPEACQAGALRYAR
jgi:hypothetical protein